MQARNQAAGPKNDINVTPLVDVVLVLLIIFMVITPMLQRGAPVELVDTTNPRKAKSVDGQVTISVGKLGELYLENDQKADSEIQEVLAQKYAATNGNARIFIKGDAGANYGRVRQVMKMVQDAGFPDVGLITKELKPAQGGG
jgi:biopolymer transport protein TolR